MTALGAHDSRAERQGDGISSGRVTMHHHDNDLTPTRIDRDLNRLPRRRPAQTVVQPQFQRELQPTTIPGDSLERRRDFRAHVDAALLPFGDESGKNAGDEIARPNAVVPHHEDAAIEVGNLAESLECVACLLSGGARRAKHLLLVLVQVAEVVLEQNVERESDLIESLHGLSGRSREKLTVDRKSVV